MNKRIIGYLLCMLPCVMEAGISSQYATAYSFEATQVSTGREQAISLYKEGKVIYVRDGKVYEAKIDSASGDLTAAQESSDFEQLSNISGTIAYDLKRNRIYYSQYNSVRKQDYLYESISDTAGRWQPGQRMRIRGTEKGRNESGFVQNAGWSYQQPYLAGFYNPVMAKDYNRVYFSSTMEGSQGGRDLYYVDIEDEGQRIWSLPHALDSLNSSSDDDWIFVEGDSLLYMSSSKSGTIQLYQSQKKGGEWTTPQLLAEPYNVSGDSYNMLLLEGAPLLVSTRADGSRIYAYQRIIAPEVPAEPAPVAVTPALPEPAPTYEEKKRQFYWVFFLFDFDKDILEAKFNQELDSLAAEMQQFPDARFEISGYTDSRGTEVYNDELSQRRADTIKRLLIGKGFKEESLVSIGWGERRLQVPDAQTEEEHAQNRRVEVRIIMDKK